MLNCIILTLEYPTDCKFINMSPTWLFFIFGLKLYIKSENV